MNRAGADEWGEAAKQIVYIAPAKFPGLPKDIVQKLTERNCKIPQSPEIQEPHNVVKGEFAKPGQTDWAALCSKDGKSSVLIFWGGSAPCPAELRAPELDQGYLQGMGEGKIAYSRIIAALKPGKKQKLYGLDDGFSGKGSTTYVCRKGKWIDIGGSD
jgi:hypothetical protein